MLQLWATAFLPTSPAHEGLPRTAACSRSLALHSTLRFVFTAICVSLPMPPSLSLGNLQQSRRNLHAAVEILDGLWLDAARDIEEDVIVPATPNHQAVRSRIMAARVKEQILGLLGRHSEDEVESAAWVGGYQDEVRKELKRYENMFQKGRNLYDVSWLTAKQSSALIGFAVCAKLYAANHTQLSARFNIRFNQQLGALEPTRRIHRALHNELGLLLEPCARASGSQS